MVDTQKATSSRQDKKSGSLSLEDFQKQIHEAYNGYLKEYENISTDAQKKYQEAYSDAVKTFQERLSSIKDQNQGFDIYCEAVKSFQKAFSPEDFSKRSAEAYQKYLGTVRESWAQLDIGTIY